MVLKKTPESPLDSKEIKPVNLKGYEPWIFTGRTVAEAEAPVFWASDVSRQHIGKILDTGKDWGQKEKKASEDGMVGHHHRWNEHEIGQTREMLRDRDAWGAAVHGITDSQKQLRDWTSTTVHISPPSWASLPRPANRFICTIFLDSTYICWYTIFVLLFWFFPLYDSL